jgi:hypothetical protein
MRYLPCGPPLVGTALMPVGRHAIHFTITCGVLRKPAGRVNSLNTLPYRVPVLNDRPAIREISPPWHPDDLLVPFNVLHSKPDEAMVCNADDRKA